MIFSRHELWTIIHGFLLGGIILLSFAGVAEGLRNLKQGMLTEQGAEKCLKRLKLCLGIMTAASWLVVLLGTYRIYAWYRENTPESPQSRLLADPAISVFHTFGMEWKEHVAWMVPILFTTAAFIVFQYQQDLVQRQTIRRAVSWLLFAGFATAGIVGLLGAFINKVAPFL